MGKEKFRPYFEVFFQLAMQVDPHALRVHRMSI